MEMAAAPRRQYHAYYWAWPHVGTLCIYTVLDPAKHTVSCGAAEKTHCVCHNGQIPQPVTHEHWIQYKV